MNPTALYALFSLASCAALFFLMGRAYEYRRQRKHLNRARHQFREALRHRPTDPTAS